MGRPTGWRRCFDVHPPVPAPTRGCCGRRRRRHPAQPPIGAATRAPSTVGTWLRAHKWSNVRQLDAVSRGLLARLWAAGAGPADLGAPLTIDVDSTIVEVAGRREQGTAFGYTRTRGYHPQLATCAETGQVLMSRLRGERPTPPAARRAA